ncbi:MAG: GntR family transcriptional regulator [Anaerolineales bacterium]|jgi:DNA-binding GntR family transcriptional regulator
MTTEADKAYRLIKDRIITIAMRPGSVIRETELMNELDIGRTPIREALKRLQAENLIIVNPRQGMFVADIPITDLIGIYEVRVELESLCVYLASKRMTPELLAEMQELAKSYESWDRTDLKGLLEKDRRFHMLLACAAENRFLASEIEHYYNLSLRIWHLALSNVSPEDVDIEAHLDILHAIENRDHERARQRMREHIQHFHASIKEIL